MITLTAAAQAVLGRSQTRYLSVSSWLGSTLLADDVPVSSASEETDRSLAVPERITLTVPRIVRGQTWSPVADDHPLACNGQRLIIRLGVGVGGSVEWFQRGVFIVHDTATDDETVTVNAVGLLALVDEARLVSPYQPTGTLVSTLRALIEPALTVVVDSALIDRSVPSGINYDEDRLGAVRSLVDAWPADYYVDPAGYLRVVPATQSITPVLALTNGVGGTVITATGASTRDGAANVVVARGTAPDGGQLQGVAYLTTGSKAYGGQFNPLPVPYFYSSPLLTTTSQCSDAAATILDRLQRTTSREFAVTCVPRPDVQVGDVVSLTTDDYVGLVCVVESLTLPYTPEGGAMALKVRTVDV